MKYLYTVAIVCSLFFSNNRVYSQEILNKDSLVYDFSFLIKQLEEIHPDPYSGFGGKLFFYNNATELKDDLKNTPCTKQEFLNKISRFISNLRDGHTTLHASSSQVEEGYLPLSVRTIPDGLIFTGLPPEYKDLLGSRIESINGIPLDSILLQVPFFAPSENEYGSYRSLRLKLRTFSFLSKILPDLKDAVRFEVSDPNGAKKDLMLHFSGEEYGVPLAEVPQSANVPSDKYMSYAFLDSRKQVMLFKITTIQARESFKYMRDNHFQAFYDSFKRFYRYDYEKEMPADTLQAIANAPSFSETFLTMLKDMKKHNTKTLIIDLRGNGGGATPIVFPALYMMYGDSYLQKKMDTKSYLHLSSQYLSSRGETLEDFNKENNGNYQIGDYVLEDENSNETNIITKRRNFLKDCLSETKTEMEKQNGMPVYTPPKIYVITDEFTFSAAFHFAFYLWKMGAIIVGVPCMQAPDTFMDQVPIRLPYTKIKGGIPCYMQIFLPANDKRAKIFWPDIMLSYDDYKKYQFDTNAEVLYLLDNIDNQHLPVII